MIWAVFVLMAGFAGLLLALPLLRAKPAGGARIDYDLAVYKDQLAEVEREVERGTLATAEAEAARTEIQRRMLAAADADASTAAGTPAKGNAAAAIVVAALVPALAFGLYLTLGSPSLPDQPYAQRPQQPRMEPAQAEMIANMVRGLAQRLEQNPDDAKGWSMLARSYRVMGNVDGALEAYAKALPLLPKEVDLRVEYAEFLLELLPPDQTRLPEAVVKTMREVLALDPANTGALYYVGLAEADAGNKAEARLLWGRILAALPPDSPGRAELEAQIEALK